MTTRTPPSGVALKAEIDGLLHDLELIGPQKRAFHVRALRFVAKVRTQDVMLAAALLARQVEYKKPTPKYTSGIGYIVNHVQFVEECLGFDAVSQRAAGRPEEEAMTKASARQQLHQDLFKSVIGMADEQFADGAGEARTILKAALSVAIERLGREQTEDLVADYSLMLNARRSLAH